jgi:hypothetical protein
MKAGNGAGDSGTFPSATDEAMPGATLPNANLGRDGWTKASKDINDRMATVISKTPFQHGGKSGLSLLQKGAWRNRSGCLYLVEALGVVYMRPSYYDLYRILDECFRGPKRRNCEVLITGTSGIGKSQFGKALLRLIMGRPKPVLILHLDLQWSQSPSVEVFWQGATYRLHMDHVQGFLGEVSTLDGLYSDESHDDDSFEVWCVADSVEPIDFPFIKKVCISSPGIAQQRRESIRRWSKVSCALELS